MARVVNMEKHLAFLVSDRSNRRYFSGLDIAEGYVLAFDKVYYFTDARYYYGVKSALIDNGCIPILYNGLESIKEVLIKEHIQSLLIDFDNTTLSEYEKLKTLNVTLSNGTEDLQALRIVKTQNEIKAIKKSCDICFKAYLFGIKHIKLGMTERQLANIIEKAMVRYGAEGPSFDTIVAFGENSRVPHHETGETSLKEGDVVLIDMGCKVDGYCSDLTRTSVYGEPSAELKNIYEEVLKANILAEEHIVQGISAKQADTIARDSLKKVGLDSFFTHSLGHGIGLDIHEPPFLSSKSNTLLLDKMVFSIEPGVYTESIGVRIEDTVLLEDGKVVRLFKDDKKLINLKK